MTCVATTRTQTRCWASRTIATLCEPPTPGETGFTPANRVKLPNDNTLAFPQKPLLPLSRPLGRVSAWVFFGDALPPALLLPAGDHGDDYGSCLSSRCRCFFMAATALVPRLRPFCPMWGQRPTGNGVDVDGVGVGIFFEQPPRIALIRWWRFCLWRWRGRCFASAGFGRDVCWHSAVVSKGISALLAPLWLFYLCETGAGRSFRGIPSDKSLWADCSLGLCL